MINELPTLNKHFHAYAKRYQGGDIVILLDGSDANQNAYTNNQSPIDSAIDAALFINKNLKHKTRVIFYGDDKTLREREIDLSKQLHVANPLNRAPGGDLTALAPTLEKLRQEYPDSTPDHPLHIIIVSAGGNTDRDFMRLRKSVKDWLDEPGKQLLLDVIFTTRNHAPLAGKIGPASSHLLDSGKSINPDKPGLNVHQAFTAVQLLTSLASAINQRTAPPNPEQFMIDLVAETVRKGTCNAMICPSRATFAKKIK